MVIGVPGLFLFVYVVEYAGFCLEVEFFEGCGDALHWLYCYAVEGSGCLGVVAYCYIVYEGCDVCAVDLAVSFDVVWVVWDCGNVMDQSMV